MTTQGIDKNITLMGISPVDYDWKSLTDHNYFSIANKYQHNFSDVFHLRLKYSLYILSDEFY